LPADDADFIAWGVAGREIDLNMDSLRVLDVSPHGER